MKASGTGHRSTIKFGNMAARAGKKSPVQIAFLKWINNPGKVMSWMQRYDIEQLLEDGNGLAKISNFLPEKVADGALELIESYPREVWNETAADRDPATNNIVHKFWSTKQAPGLSELVRAISVIMPGRLHTFSAGKYVRTNRIEPHDDRAYTDVQMENGKMVTCSRDIAVIWYLTKNWKESDGGVLIDCETGKRYVPEYNSAVTFRIPRYHEVTAVEADRARYSVFGWFLQPGIHYDLYKCVEPHRTQGGRAGSNTKADGEETGEGSRKAAISKPSLKGKRKVADAGIEEEGAPIKEQASSNGMQHRRREIVARPLYLHDRNRALTMMFSLVIRSDLGLLWRPKRLMGLARLPRPFRYMYVTD